MTIFSFHPVKAITSAEGGMVTTRDAELRRAPAALPQPRDRQRPGATRP